MLLLIPAFNVGGGFLPAESMKVLPFLIIGLAVLAQSNALLDYKIIEGYKKAAHEYTNVQSKLSRDLQEKENTLEKQSKLFEELQKKAELLSQSNQTMEAELKTFERSLDEAHQNLVLTEKKLQESVQENSRIKNQSSSSDAVTALSLLQERGRFLDFFMEDIAGYSDADVGAAARLVHQGSSKVLTEFFHIIPLHKESEGSHLTLQKQDPLQAFRLLGKGFESFPVNVKIVHRGWGTENLNLPKRTTAPVQLDGKFVISPVEVELF